MTTLKAEKQPIRFPWGRWGLRTIALSYLDLAASSFGLGTCWAGYFHAAATMWPPMRNAVDLPERHTCFGAMMIGYPKYTYHRLPLRNEPRITWR